MSERTKGILIQGFFIVVNVIVVVWVFLFLTLRFISVSGSINDVAFALSFSGYDWIFHSAVGQAIFLGTGRVGLICFLLAIFCSVYAVLGAIETDLKKKAQKTEKALALLFVASISFFVCGIYVGDYAEKQGWTVTNGSHAIVAAAVTLAIVAAYFVLKRVLSEKEEENAQIVSEDGQTVVKIKKGNRIKSLSKSTKIILKYKKLLDNEAINEEEYEKVKETLLP